MKGNTMWIRDNVFEYKIASNPTRKHFREIVNIIVNNDYTFQEIELVKAYCYSKNPRFNEDIFYNEIENKRAMLDEGSITNAN